MLSDYYLEVAEDLAEHEFFQICGARGPAYPNPAAKVVCLQDLGELSLGNYCAVVVNGVVLPPGFLDGYPGRKIWFIWGFEAYATSYFTNYYFPGPRLIHSQTRRILFPGLKEKGKAFVRDLKRLRDRCRSRASLSQFDTLACIYREEYDLVTKRMSLPGLKHWELPVVSLEHLLDTSSEGGSGEADRILLGNSAAPENNHLEAFEQILPYRDEVSRIVCPLSYGNSGYADRVAARGEKLFGDKFVAIRDFLPKEEYNALVGRCGTVIMNHRRQAALGNIWSAIFQGSFVWLGQSVVSEALRRHGIIFGDIAGFRAGRTLSVEESRKNRAILREVLGQGRIRTILREKIGECVSFNE